MWKMPAAQIGAVLFLLSSFTLFLLAREAIINNSIVNRYELMTVNNQNEYSDGLDSSIVEVNGYEIEIIEQPTGRKETLPEHELQFGELPREIIKAQIVVNGKKIAEPYEIKLAARMDHTRYFRYLEILTVYDKRKKEERVAILVTTQLDEIGRTDAGWDILWLDGDNVTKENFTLQKRGNHLAARMINYAALTNMSFGYYSDIAHYYPSLAYPIFYPFGTGAAGLALMIVGFFKSRQMKTAK